MSAHPSEPPADGIVLHAEHDAPSTEEAIKAGLLTYNRRFTAVPHWSPLRVAARDPQGGLVGGITGATAWEETGAGWLYVGLLWVDDTHRRQGLGVRLMSAAESEAMRRGCRRAYLDTLEFQARPFYERLGYAVFGVQDDFPPGSRRYLLQKTFGAL